MKPIMILLIIASAVATPSAVNAAPEQIKSVSEKPICGNLFVGVRKAFEREFAISASASSKTISRQLSGKNPSLMIASHPDLCGGQGCAQALFSVRNGCAQLALIFTGKLFPMGPTTKPFERIVVSSHLQGVDGGQNSFKRYVFKNQSSNYVEINN